MNFTESATADPTAESISAAMSVDPDADLTAQENEFQNRLLQIQREDKYVDSRYQPLSGNPSADDRASVANAALDKKKMELSAEWEQCNAGFQRVSAQKNARAVAREKAAVVARMPTGTKQDQARAKQMETRIRDLRKENAPVAEITAAETALVDWTRLCEGREIAVDYNAKASALALPLRRWNRLVAETPSNKQQDLAELASFIEHPLHACTSLPKVYLCPEVFQGSTDPCADGSTFFHYHPAAHE